MNAAAPGPLRVGGSRFWDGGFVESGNVSSPDLCEVEAPCPTFALPVAAGGSRLRVAIDTPSREDSFAVDLIDPQGEVATTFSNSNQFNAEGFVDTPAPGKWIVRVMPQGATLASYRLRAKLEAPSKDSADAGKAAMLPNLKSVPPYEFGFVAPANPLNGAYPPDTVNPPLEAAGVHPVSCAPDELAPVAAGGGGATKCLRLTTGPINVGTGPFDMRFTFVQDLAGGKADPKVLRGPIYQAIHYTDGSVRLRSAGTYSFHTTHAHFHDDHILTYELFKVTNTKTGGLVAAGNGTKSGFCPADQLFGEWNRFTQQPAGTFGEGDSAAGGNCFSPNDGFIGLTAGWGDVYRWQRPGQYVEFAGNPDGLYVVRTTVDKSNTVQETDDTDNSAYALIRVTGDSIHLLERGQGKSPWDGRKVVFHGAGPASLD